MLADAPPSLQANLAPSHEFAPLRLRGGGLSTQRTYAMIKPDAVKAGKVDAMQKEIINGGFKIIQQKKMTLSKAQVRASNLERATARK